MAGTPSAADLIYDWNTAGNGYPHRAQPIELERRDAARRPAVPVGPRPRHRDQDRAAPPHGGAGHPRRRSRAARRRARAPAPTSLALCQEIEHGPAQDQPELRGAHGQGRHHAADRDLAEGRACPIEACTFIGSSPIRQYAEEWTLDQMLRLTEEAVTYAVEHGLPVMYVTEDTCRATPETIRRLYQTAINAGAERICVCDTVGPHHAARGAAT